MKERPIIFSGPMVRAILGGQKTQTRRTVRHPGGFNLSGVCFGSGTPPQPLALPGLDRITCPYGKPGDRLWVRETWCIGGHGPFYKADTGDGTVHIAWRSSMFMPRKYSRITLEVTSVRVQRLQEISEKEAEAEGVNREFRLSVMVPGVKDYRIPLSYRGGFANKWNDINGKKHPWDSNPWVWCITFLRLEPTRG